MLIRVKKIVKKCPTCNKEFSSYETNKRIFCSKKCRRFNNISKEKIRLKKTGVKLSLKVKLKMKLSAKRGKNSHRWVGDKIGYEGVHGWVYRQKGKASGYKCIFCNKQAMVWANKKHDYKRNINDYISLCISCHKKYDYKYNLKPDNKIGNNQFTKKY